MKIRSITYFFNPGWPLDEKKLRNAGFFLTEAKEAFTAAGYEVQTVRLASVPFPTILGAQKIAETPKFARQFSDAIKQLGLSYAALGPALPHLPGSYRFIP
jgi:uncharacterized protein (UPF0210 family)